MTDPFEHKVLDGGRELRFNGTRLATSSSRTDGKLRWAEFELYRTTQGRYILAGVGRTLMPGEVDKFWAQVSDDPSAIVERLTMYDDREARYLPSVAQKLLRIAGVADEGIKHAFSVEVID